MMKALRNPNWIAVLISVIGLALVLIFRYVDRPVKNLRVEILSNSPLVSVDTAMPKDMQVLYKGAPVQTLSLILLKIENTGTEPITESDYSEPLRMTLSQTAAVGEVSVQETRPQGIQLSPTVTPSNQVTLARALLNPGDQAVVKILALNNDSTLIIGARIVGIHALDIQPVLGPNESRDGRWVNIVLIVMIIGVILWLPAYFIWQSRSVVEWRKRRFGFDPARHYYTLAQIGMLTLPASKGTEQASGALTQVIRNLDRCFSWDSTYLARVRAEVLFSQLLEFERFRDVARRYEAGPPDKGYTGT